MRVASLSPQPDYDEAAGYRSTSLEVPLVHSSSGAPVWAVRRTNGVDPAFVPRSPVNAPETPCVSAIKAIMISANEILIPVSRYVSRRLWEQRLGGCGSGLRSAGSEGPICCVAVVAPPRLRTIVTACGSVIPMCRSTVLQPFAHADTSGGGTTPWA